MNTGRLSKQLDSLTTCIFTCLQVYNIKQTYKFQINNNDIVKIPVGFVFPVRKIASTAQNYIQL